MRKPDFCMCENKGADQLCGNHAADQCLCFWDIASTIPLLSKSKISSLQPSSVVVLPDLCVLVGTPEDRFSNVATHLNLIFLLFLKTSQINKKTFLTFP